jgi:CheY-like chemotaxis protein
MRNILIVDDTAVDRRLAAGLLEQLADVQTSFAEDGAQAQLLIAQTSPDLVVTDLQMPNVDGLELVRWIHMEYPGIPVVLMTAQGSEEIAVEALQSGAASYVPKASLAKSLRDTVEEVLALNREDHAYVNLMACQKKMDFGFELTNDVAVIHAFTAMIQQILEGMNFCDHTGSMQAGIALKEALMNAMYRGNLELTRDETSGNPQPHPALARLKTSPYSGRRIHVDGAIGENEARITITDEGKGFDVSLAAQIRDEVDSGKLLSHQGRGLVLMHTFMDEVKFNSSGNQVTLIRKQATTLE